MFSASFLLAVVAITMTYGFCSVFTLNLRGLVFSKNFADVMMFSGLGALTHLRLREIIAV